MNRTSVRRRLFAFTLIELLVVILILGVLAALIVPKVMGHSGEAKTAKAKTDIRTLEQAVETFRLHCDRYPTTEEGLAALTNPPQDVAAKWKGPYIGQIMADPWGGQYLYTYPGPTGNESFTIMTYGKDGAQGGTGEDADISNQDVQ